jgi:hypothetical protein
LLLLGLLGAGVASCFRLGADARAVRNELIKSSGVEWRQQIALNAGWLTLGAVRAGLSCVRLDPAARAALQSIHGAGVGIYQLPAGTPPPNRAAMLVSADSAMAARGWERVVGVIDARDLVAVYFPKEISVHRLKWCWFPPKATRNRSSNMRSRNPGLAPTRSGWPNAESVGLATGLPMGGLRPAPATACF